MLRQRAATDGVGFAAVQAQGTELRFTQAGVMRRGAPAPVTDTTLFEIGSITKVFVAVLLADSVLRGAVRLDDPVESGLPDGITLRDSLGAPLRLIDLATHRSGLPRMPSNLRAAEFADPYVAYTEARLMAFLREWRPSVARDTRFDYSNLGYGLLALVLSRLAGQRLEALLATRVLGPLGLHDMRLLRPLPTGNDLALLGAALGTELASAPNEASPHNAALRQVALWRFDALAGAGGLLASARSMGRFMQVALGAVEHPLIEAVALSLKRQRAGEHPQHGVALSWEIIPLQQRLLWNHDGATVGSSCSMWLEPARGSGCVVLCNTFVETTSAALHGLEAERVSTR